MKKIVSVFLVLSLTVMLFVSCGKKDDSIRDLGGVDSGAQQTQMNNQTAMQSETESVWVPATTLSGDYHSGQIQIDGTIYDFPIKGSDFMSHGWQIVNSWDMGATYDPDDEEKVNLSNGTTKVMVDVKNYSNQPLSIDNCYFMGVNVSVATGDPVGNVIMPGGLDFKTASYYDFINKWGKPSFDGVALTSNDISYTISESGETYKYMIDFYDNLSVKSVWLLNENRPAYVSLNNNIAPSAESSYAESTYAQTEYVETTTSAPVAFINLTGLKEIENNDNCDVKITKKELINDYYKGKLVNIGETGDDACVFTIENNTGSDLKQVVFLAVGYKSNNELMKIGGTIIFFGNDKYVVQFTTQDSTIKSGSSEKIGVRCEGDELAGVCAIVYSYTTADGVEHINENATQWYQNVYQSSKTFS